MEEFIPYFIMLGIAFVALGGSALFALFWSVKDGQYANLQDSSEIIFDPDEPIGEQTDFFPGQPKQKKEKV
jgi:cbb3-type cytochrome oxidase maturation protein